MIVEPLTLPPTALVADALELMERYHVSGVPITDETGRLVGILTNRDLRFEKDVKQPVSAVMTSANLVTAPVGTSLADAEKLLHQYPDGRMDILTQGHRRFEILHLNEEKDYLRAEVAFYDDDDAGGKAAAPPSEMRAQALAHYHSLNQLGAARTHSEPDFNDPQLSFQLAQAVPDLDFLHALLLHRSEAARLKQFNEYLAEYLPKQQSIERVKDLAPKNGFAHKPAGQ
jgi:hypothetical protein